MYAIIRFFIVGLLVFAFGKLLPGASISDYSDALWVTLALSCLNIFIRPLIALLSLPITFVTLGLFSVVINTLMLILADSLVDGFHINGFWNSLLFSICLSVGMSFVPADNQSKTRK